MHLRASECELFVHLPDLHAGREPWGVGSSDRIHVEASVVPDATCRSAAVAKVKRGGVVGMARHDPSRHTQRPPVEFQIDHVGNALAMLTAIDSDALGDAQLFC